MNSALLVKSVGVKQLVSREYRKRWTGEEQARNKNHLCINCGKPTKQYAFAYGGKWKTMCSDECEHGWWVTHDWSYLKMEVFRERGYNCEKCGKESSWSGSVVVDHIVPISLGGWEFDKGNLQILCLACDRIKTKEDRKQIAIVKRVANVFSLLQTLIQTPALPFKENNTSLDKWMLSEDTEGLLK